MTALHSHSRRSPLEGQRRTEIALIKKRMEVVFLSFLAALGVLALRLAHIQMGLGGQFTRVADRMTARDREIEADRGRLLDRNGEELAQDVNGKAIILNPRLVVSPDATAARLAELLRADPDERRRLEQRIRSQKERGSFYCLVRRGVENREARAIQAAVKGDPLLKGLAFREAPVRIYPSEGDGIHVVGSLDATGSGLEGMELQYDSILRGKNGRVRVRVNGTGEAIPETEERVSEPVEGHNVRLALDRDIQHIVETEIARVMKQEHPDSVSSVVMEVNTGDVLAMANLPAFEPGERGVPPEHRRNRAVTDSYEPGSTFKAFTAAAALEARVDTQAHCSGTWTVSGYTMHCAHGAVHGSVNLRHMLAQSCNLAAGTLAERVGAAKLHAFLVKCGFGTRTGIGFPGEASGLLRSPRDWRRINTINIGFGQGLSVSPLQLIAAFSAIANDGVYMPPRLVLDAPGAALAERPPRRIMSSGTAQQLRDSLQWVVTNGTGTRAKIPGYTVAGKTGTAQLVEGGRYVDGYVASFVGFVPARRPRLAILVSVWRPRVHQYGGEVAAPVFHNIAQQCLLYGRVPEDAPLDRRDGIAESTPMNRSLRD